MRVSAFPVDSGRASQFVSQIVKFLKDLEADFDSAWVCDHFVPWASWQSPETDNLECWSTICYLSAHFPKLLWGSIVMCNSYRPPSLVAKMAATLTVLSGGRFVLGLGAGWKEDEYRAYGYPFPSPSVRINQLDEAVQVIRALWTQSPASFHGRYYRLENAYCHPQPDPPPPIMIGGGGEKLTLKVVARHADWWNMPNVDSDTYAQKLQVLVNHCERVGRNYREITKTYSGYIAIATTDAQARALAATSPFVNPKTIGRILMGSPSTIHRELAGFIDLGAQHFILRFLDFPKTKGARLFAEEVLPSFTQ